MDGLTVYNFGPGHSYGMLRLLVELPERSYDYDNDVATVARIKELAAEKNAQVWPARDLAWFEGMTKATDGFYA